MSPAAPRIIFFPLVLSGVIGLQAAGSQIPSNRRCGLSGPLGAGAATAVVGVEPVAVAGGISSGATSTKAPSSGSGSDASAAGSAAAAGTLHLTRGITAEFSREVSAADRGVVIAATCRENTAAMPPVKCNACVVASETFSTKSETFSTNALATPPSAR